MIKILKNIAGKIKSSPYIEGNTTQVNLFLLLLIISFFTVGADLSKEMASEKGEVEFFAAVLDESVSTDSFAYLDHLKSDAPLLGCLQTDLIQYFSCEFISLANGRSPPELS